MKMITSGLSSHHHLHHQQHQIGWELKINVCEFDIIEQSLLVTGDMHIGSVIFQLVEQLGNIRNDWSDFAIWWPDKNQWLNRTKFTLDQYGVQADANLYFTRMHKPLRVQLPDQQYLEINADFSINVFNTVKKICKELGIRHHEEVSLLKINLQNEISTSNKKNKDKSSKDKNKSNNDSNIKMQQSKSSLLNTSILSQMTNQSGSLKDSSIIININGNKENANGSLSSTSATSTLNNSSSNNSSNDASSKLLRHRSQSLSIENGNGSLLGNGFVNINDPQSLALSPIISTQDYLSKNEIKYKSIFDKTRENVKWLDSSKSLMEQNVRENDLVQLRFKYYAFFDLNTKLDSIRLNQIYEQAKWSILSEEIDCTETELIQFAALQLQIQIQTKQCINQTGANKLETLLTLERTNSQTPTPNKLLLNRTNSHYSNNTSTIEGYYKNGNNNNDSNNHGIIAIRDEDDVDTALSKLEKSLDIVDNNNQNAENLDNNDIINNCDIIKHDSSIELCEELFLMKNQKYTIKKFKSYYFILNDTHYLSYYKSKEDSNGRPIDKINLRGCELAPDVNVSSRKYGIIIKVPSSDGMNELMIRCPNDESYASWMSACKLASKNRSIADPTYLNEVKSILNLLQMQQQIKSSNVKNGKSATMLSKSGSISSYFTIADNAEVQPTNLLPARMIKKHKLKQLNDKILEEYSTISDLELFEAKWRYIKEWQGLPNYGMTYFMVKVRGSRFKEEILCLTSNRIIRMSPDGEQLKSWRLNTMKSWNVNWEIRQFEIIFEEEQIVFLCSHCDPKILHEFIGAYIYLSLRVKDKSETLSEDMFFKLTEKR